MDDARKVLLHKMKKSKDTKITYTKIFYLLFHHFYKNTNKQIKKHKKQHQ